ncbi:MAG: TlpA disulfide reductase family protein [Thermoplasmatota archaeon]
MKKRAILLLPLLFLSLTLSGCLDDDTASSGTYTFTTLSGETRALSDYEGSVVVLDMMATWCQPCQYQMLELRHVRENYSESEVVILSVDIDEKETAQQLQQFKQQFTAYGYDLDWTFGMDDGNISTAYLGEGIPTICIFSPAGDLSFSHEGIAVYDDIPEGLPADTTRLKPVIDDLL